MVMGLIIGILVAIHGFHRRTPQPVFKSLLIQRIQKLSISFKNVVFAQIKISAINTLLFILFAFVLLPLWGSAPSFCQNAYYFDLHVWTDSNFR